MSSGMKKRFSPLGPTALLGLLYTIVLMFAMQGDKILAHPLDVRAHRGHRSWSTS